MKRFVVLLLVLAASRAFADASVRTVDFLQPLGVPVNGAGPTLVRMDEPRNRLIAANTLTSSLTIIDCETGAIENIPLGGRAFQHLKNEALALNRRTGEIFLIGARCFSVVHPETRKAETFLTDVQFESVAVDDETGTAVLVGRESGEIALYTPGTKKLKMKEWVDHSEPLINLNATPPPPIRKVIADSDAGKFYAVDGFTSTLYVFESKKAGFIRSRSIPLASGGRWHLAGFDPNDHALYIVTETTDRKVIQAGKIDVEGGEDKVVPLPEFTEAVGVLYNAVRKEVYIPYDNHPSVHVVTFEDSGAAVEIKIPAYGNDASALDIANEILYIGSWAHGEVDVIDLKRRTLQKRITDLGIIPHMFAMAFNPKRNLVYFPKGASAVNGTFGAAITALDPATGETSKIRTGWAPIDLIEVPSRKSFLVFNSEDEFADVRPDGACELHALPVDYPIRACPAPGGDVYLSYGPHQSYWPVVYIWGARNGVLGISSKDLAFYDRRIPRQAQEIVADRDGVAYFTQNNWGEEEQFIGVLEDPVRLFDINKRLRLRDKVTREITQRILSYDAGRNTLYLVRVGETDEERSTLQVIDLAADSAIAKVSLGLTATSLCDAGDRIFVSNFDSQTVSAVDKTTFAVENLPAGKQPLKICRAGGDVFVINNGDNTLQRLTGKPRTQKIPFRGAPDNLIAWDDKLVITSHNAGALIVSEFDPGNESFTQIHRFEYPYADTRFDAANVSFYVRGQFGDAVFSLTQGRTDSEGRLWLTDFLSGKLFILERKAEI
jgi:DNA-binding beta-propeller fold protein YncE